MMSGIFSSSASPLRSPPSAGGRRLFEFHGRIAESNFGAVVQHQPLYLPFVDESAGAAPHVMNEEMASSEVRPRVSPRDSVIVERDLALSIAANRVVVH